MTTPTDVAILDYHSFQTRVVAGSSQPVGLTEGWAAPVAIFEASNGSGEAAWVSTPMPGRMSNIAASG